MTDGWVMNEIENQDNPYEGYEEAMNEAAINDLKREYRYIANDGIFIGPLARQDREMMFRELAQKRDTIEYICSTLMTLGGWEEIDGDGTEVTIIAGHIRDLYRDERDRVDHMRRCIQEIRDLHQPTRGEERCAVCGLFHPCPTQLIIERFDEADL